MAGQCCCDYMVCQEIKKSYQLNTPYQLMPSIFTVLKMKIPSEGINLSLCAVLYLLCVNLNTDCINQYVKTVYVDYEIYEGSEVPGHVRVCPGTFVLIRQGTRTWPDTCPSLSGYQFFNISLTVILTINICLFFR